MLSASDFMGKDGVKCIKCTEIDFLHTMTVVELDDGVVVEFTSIDDEGTTLTETLFSKDRKIFTLIGRWRAGENYHKMRSYDRDNKYPLKGVVRI